MRGADNYEDENGNGVSTDVRSSIHGDVLHSRPLVINYFTGSADDVVVYYGSNDGAFHAVSGNKSGAASDGQEIWSFVAKEFLPKLGRLITQDPSYGTVAPFTPRSYFFDGPIGFYTEDANKDEYWRRPTFIRRCGAVDAIFTRSMLPTRQLRC